MREENLFMFLKGNYDTEEVNLYTVGEEKKRMVDIKFNTTKELQRFTKTFKDMRNLMEVDVEDKKLTMDRDDLESILFLALILDKANDLFSNN